MKNLLMRVLGMGRSPLVLALLVVVLAYATAALVTVLARQDLRYARVEYVSEVLDAMAKDHHALLRHLHELSVEADVERARNIRELKIFILESEIRITETELFRVRSAIMPSRDYLGALMKKRADLAAQLNALRNPQPTPRPSHR